MKKYVFGPVPSRRLGRSLGVDLVPFKTCSFDCIYCQLGRTAETTAQPRNGIDVDEVLAEVRERLATRPDHITLSGSGDPTLSANLGEVIGGIRAMTDIPIAVLTNGGLLYRPEVRRRMMDASLVVPSLDAGDEAMFRAINRPHPDVTFARLVEGLIALREEFDGQYWLEVMLLGGHTAVDAEVRKIAGLIERIKPDRVQLNTVTRPPAEAFATAVSPTTLRRLAKMLPGPVEIIVDRTPTADDSPVVDGETEVFELLRRRPCTIDDIQDALRLRPDTAKYFIFQYNTIDDTESYEYKSDPTSRNTHQPDTMKIDTTYYWFVKAQDKAGNWSEWSSPFTVKVRAPLPGKPVLSAPAKASYVNDATPELSWNAVDYGLTYDVQVSSSSRFTTIQSEASGQAELTFTTTNLPDGKFYWRVRATNDTGTGSWSSAYYFVVDTADPAVPVLRSPADISTVIGSPTFKWYRASGAKYYQFAYNTLDDPETALYTSDWVSSTSMKITSMDFLTQYYWFVQSKDKAGNSSGWSAGNTIIVLPPKPGRVTTTSPSSGAITDDTELTLTWNAVNYGYTYEYEIDDSSRFNSVDYSGTSDVEATSDITDTLETGRWYWHVRAVNENGTAGSWSSTRYFTIYPKFNSTFETDADFEDWAAAAGASWSVASGSLSTAGLTGGYSTSADYSAADFSDFTYEADMQMDAPASGESNTYGLVLRGTPSFDEWNDWTDGIYFTVRQVNDSLTSTQYACALAYKIASGKWTYLGGSCAEAVYGDFNNLKVYAKSRTLKFYVNDYLILSTSTRGPYSGKLGVVSWGASVTSASVSAAAAGVPVQPIAATASSLSAQSVTLPAGVTPKVVFNQMKK